VTSLSTPCIHICILNPETGLCEGCGRTLAEISAWSAMSEAERLRIIAQLPHRLRKPAAPQNLESR
jgi:predicted Fe-S protein YdhL (DUF1289 family)